MSKVLRIPNVSNNNQSNDIPILVPIDSKPVREVVTLTSISLDTNCEESQLPVMTKIIPVKKKSFFESFSKGSMTRSHSHEISRISRKDSHKNSCISLNPLERTLSFLGLKTPEKEKVSGRKSIYLIRKKSEVDQLSDERRAGQIILRLFLNGRRRSSIRDCLVCSRDRFMTVNIGQILNPCPAIVPIERLFICFFNLFCHRFNCGRGGELLRLLVLF
jgi:hypothetical protein